MKFHYGFAICSLTTGAVCHALNPSVNFSPQAGTQNILSDNQNAVPGHNPLTYCSENHEDDILQIKYLNVDPNPIKRGQTISIDLAGQLLEDVTDGAYVTVTIKLGMIKLLQMSFDICDNVSRANITCPIEKGPTNIHSEIEIPETIPPAKFNLNAIAYTDDDRDLFCLKSNIDFMPPFL